MSKLTHDQNIAIVADRASGMSLRAIAKKYNVSTYYVKKAIEGAGDISQKITQKKEESVKTVLEYMEGKTADVCGIIDRYMEALLAEDKIATASAPQIATVIGILIDKFTQNGFRQSGEKSNLLDTLKASTQEDIDTDDLSEIE